MTKREITVTERVESETEKPRHMDKENLDGEEEKGKTVEKKPDL